MPAWDLRAGRCAARSRLRFGPTAPADGSVEKNPAIRRTRTPVPPVIRARRPGERRARGIGCDHAGAGGAVHRQTPAQPGGELVRRSRIAVMATAVMAGPPLTPSPPARRTPPAPR